MPVAPTGVKVYVKTWNWLSSNVLQNSRRQGVTAKTNFHSFPKFCSIVQFRVFMYSFYQWWRWGRGRLCMCMSVCYMMIQLFDEQEVGRMKMKCIAELLFSEMLIPNICQLLLLRFSPVRFQISHPLAKILHQYDAAVWWDWVNQNPPPHFQHCFRHALAPPWSSQKNRVLHTDRYNLDFI